MILRSHSRGKSMLMLTLLEWHARFGTSRAGVSPALYDRAIDQDIIKADDKRFVRLTDRIQGLQADACRPADAL